MSCDFGSWMRESHWEHRGRGRRKHCSTVEPPGQSVGDTHSEPSHQPFTSDYDHQAEGELSDGGTDQVLFLFFEGFWWYVPMNLPQECSWLLIPAVPDRNSLNKGSALPVLLSKRSSNSCAWRRQNLGSQLKHRSWKLRDGPRVGIPAKVNFFSFRLQMHWKLFFSSWQRCLITYFVLG